MSVARSKLGIRVNFCCPSASDAKQTFVSARPFCRSCCNTQFLIDQFLNLDYLAKDWGAAHYLFFSNGNPQPVVIGQDNSAISSEQSMRRSLLEFSASDGRAIRAYLTIRDDVALTGDAPLIVLSNGSQHAFETRRYQWLAQYLASRGFVVVQPGIRGVEYGPDFMPRSDLNWGNKYESDYPPSLLMYYKGGDSMFYYSMKDMNRALTRKKVSVELVKLPGFDFQLSEFEARPVLLKSISQFVEQHL